MNYKLAFIYNLLKISLRKKYQPVQINKESTKQPLVIREHEPKLFNKSPSKYTYPMGMK
jgi:hypothetical protein